MIVGIIAALIFGGDENGSEDSKSDSPETAAESITPANATCGEITFGNKRFPDATEANNQAVSRALVEELGPRANVPEDELAVAVGIVLLGICNQTKDSDYQPAPQLRVLAEDAIRLARSSDTDFLTAFTATGLTARGFPTARHRSRSRQALPGTCRCTENR